MHAAMPILAPGRGLSLQALARAGVTLAGRPVAVAGERVAFDGSLATNVAAGDAFATRARAMVWRPVMTTQTALGRRGPDRVCGHVCPECDAAIDEAGAIGQTAIGWAVITHVGRTSQTRAKRLRALLDEDFPPVLLGWGVLNRPPNREPWGTL